MIRTPVVQTWLVQRVAGYLSSELNTNVDVDRVEISFFKTLTLKGLYVEDLHHDTLLYAGELNSHIDLFSLSTNQLILDDIEIENGIFKLQKYKNEKGLNFKFLVDYFSTTKKDTTPVKPFQFNPGQVRLKNMVFAYRDNRYNDKTTGIDYDDMRFENLQAELDNIEFDEDTVRAAINNISFIEKSGFKVEYFESRAAISPVMMEFDEMDIKTPESHVQGNITFNFNDFDEFDEFIEKVKIKSEFEDTELSSNDLVYFANELTGLDKTITFNGKIKGTINQLRGKDLEVEFGDHSRFKGDVNIVGLPDFQESFIDLVVTELVTDKQEIEQIPQYPFDEGNFIELPSNLSYLGKVSFTGKFTGFLNDFVAYGNVQTALGYFSSDINLKIDRNQFEKSSYSGHLSAINFNIGKLTKNDPLIGNVSFNSKVSGSGFSLNHVNAKMDGIISAFYINGYNYSSLTVNGKLAKKKFNGMLTVRDPNLNLDFSGDIDLAQKIPLFDFTSTISNAKLVNLNLINRDTSSTLNTTLDISIRGKQFDELTGSILALNSSYYEGDKKIELDSLYFESHNEFGIKKASLRSDIVDADFNGIYRRSTMISEVTKLLSKYIPTLSSPVTTSNDILKVDYDLKFKETDAFFKMFLPQINIHKESAIDGTLDNVSGLVTLNVNSQLFQYGNFDFSDIKLSVLTEGQKLKFVNNLSQITVSDTLRFYQINLTGSTTKNASSFSLNATSRDSSNSRFLIKGETEYLPTGSIKFRLLPSEIVLDKKTWNIDETNFSIIDSGYVAINNLTFNSGNEKIALNGKISGNETDELDLEIKDFESSVLNPLLAVFDVKIGGTATGKAEFFNLLGKPKFNSKIQMTNLAVFDDTLGNANVDANYEDQLKIVDILGTVDRGGNKSIEVSGKYIIRDKDDSLDFVCNMKKTNLTAFSAYLTGLASDIKGKATGELYLKGTAKKPLLTGKLLVQQASFRVDYLNTRYNFSDEVEFNEKYIRFKNITINDVEGNTANLDGYIYHNHLRDFVLSFNIRAKNFQMLNTNFAQNDLYYGTGYGSGLIKITGPLDMITMDLGLKTERNTQIFIPLSNPEEISKSNFINFVTPGQAVVKSENSTVDLTGIEMNFQLEVTPDADIQLIFDSKIGDVIKGRGRGNIDMTINTQGDFRMYGDYQVESGDYLFTLQNLINKKFIINQGGTIRWSGSPYEAIIDLEGVYKLRASLYDLLQDTTYKKRIPVEVYLSLKDQLFNPTIKFRINVPDIDPTEETLINRYINTEQEISKQTMSLLVLNRFSKGEGLDYLGNSSSGVSANASEFLSQQLSVWASQISDVVNVGVNYRPADAFSQKELEVALSTQLFNDRVLVESNLGVSDNNRNTSELVGDFNVEVKVSKDGKFKFKAFNKTINNNFLNNYNSPYTQGIGVFYKEEFDTVGELIRRFRDRFRKDKKEKVML